MSDVEHAVPLDERASNNPLVISGISCELTENAERPSPRISSGGVQADESKRYTDTCPHNSAAVF